MARYVFRETRGTLTGNRGVIHNEKQEIVKNFRVKRWIICSVEIQTLSAKSYDSEALDRAFLS